MFSTQLLMQDRKESVSDVGVCTCAILNGIKEYSGGSVQERLDTNNKIIEKIDAELKRRGE